MLKTFETHENILKTKILLAKKSINNWCKYGEIIFMWDKEKL